MNSILPILVSLVGLAIAGIGLLGVAAPIHLTRFLGNWRVPTGLSVTFALHIVFGSIFVIAAQIGTPRPPFSRPSTSVMTNPERISAWVPLLGSL